MKMSYEDVYLKLAISHEPLRYKPVIMDKIVQQVFHINYQHLTWNNLMQDEKLGFTKAQYLSLIHI